MSAISIKSYLFPENVKVSVGNMSKGDEIRRFNLSLGGPNGVYQSFMEKIRSVYGNIVSQNEELSAYWLDDENELIGFSSDSEMQYAIDVQETIRMSQPLLKSPNNLFKVYISRKSKIETETVTAKPDQEPQIHLGVVCDCCNGSIIGVRRKCMECPDYDLCQGCHEKGAHQESGHNFILFDKPVKRQCPYMNGNGHRRGAFRGCRRQQKTQEGGAASWGSPNSFQQVLDNIGPFISSSLPKTANPEQLKSVGEFLKAFLDPFGIDCDYHVETKDKEVKKEEAEKLSTENKETEKVTKTEEKTNEDKKMETEEDESIGIRVFPTPFEQPAAATAPTKEESNARVSPFDAAASALKNAINSINVSSSAASASATATSNKSPSNSFSEPDDFNVVDFHKEIKIINAIEQLKAMGYSDDGGWLTRMVTNKEGNINAVLDAILPQAK